MMDFGSERSTAKRLNRDLESDWIWPTLPDSLEGQERFLDVIGNSVNPVFITSLAGLWGGKISLGNRFVMASCHVRLHEALDRSHAANLVQANLIELLSCLSVWSLGSFGLVVEDGIGEAQLAGFFEVAESARQEGMIDSLALIAKGGERVVRAAWQIHDAFDFLVFLQPDQDMSGLAPLARDRNVSIVAPREAPGADFRLWTHQELLNPAQVL